MYDRAVSALDHNQQRTEFSDDDQTRAHVVSRARHVQAYGTAGHSLANISRSDGILSVLFGEPQRRFESRLREGKRGAIAVATHVAGKPR